MGGGILTHQPTDEITRGSPYNRAYIRRVGDLGGVVQTHQAANICNSIDCTVYTRIRNCGIIRGANKASDQRPSGNSNVSKRYVRNRRIGCSSKETNVGLARKIDSNTCYDMAISIKGAEEVRDRCPIAFVGKVNITGQVVFAGGVCVYDVIEVLGGPDILR